jgi:hypothetical protein
MPKYIRGILIVSAGIVFFILAWRTHATYIFHEDPVVRLTGPER